MNFCKKCNTMLRDGALFCTHCGSGVQSSSRGSRFCPKCQASFGPEQIFCDECGTLLNETGSVPALPDKLAGDRVLSINALREASYNYTLASGTLNLGMAQITFAQHGQVLHSYLPSQLYRIDLDCKGMIRRLSPRFVLTELNGRQISFSLTSRPEELERCVDALKSLTMTGNH